MDKDGVYHLEIRRYYGGVIAELGISNDGKLLALDLMARQARARGGDGTFDDLQLARSEVYGDDSDASSPFSKDRHLGYDVVAIIRLTPTDMSDPGRVQVTMRGSHNIVPRVSAYVVRLLAEMARSADWSGALMLIDTPAELAVPMQLQLQLQQAEWPGSICQHPTNSNRVLFLPHTLKPGSSSTPIKAALDGMPCLLKESGVAVDAEDSIGCHIYFTPPLVFSYFGGQTHTLKLLSTSDSTNCELHLPWVTENSSGDVQRLGDFLLVHGLHAEDPEREMWDEEEHIKWHNEEILRMAEEDGAEDGALASLEEDLLLHMLAGVDAAGAKAAARLNTMLRMAATFKAQAAAARIEAAYLAWKYRMEVEWNPNTETGRNKLIKNWERWLREDDDAETPDRLKPAMLVG